MNLNVPPEISLLYAEYHVVEKMTRSSDALKRDGSVMADSALVDFLSGSTDSAINFSESTDSATNFSGSADLHTPPYSPTSCTVRLIITKRVFKQTGSEHVWCIIKKHK